MTEDTFMRVIRLNKKETIAMLDFISSPGKVSYTVQTPPAEEASRETLERLFKKKEETI